MAKEQDHPDINSLVHPPIVALLFLVIAYFLRRFVPLPYTPAEFLRVVGLALILFGFVLGLGAFVEFYKAHTTLNPHGSATHLVTSGIYRFTRNPIYLGFLLIIIGLPLNSGSYWGLVLSPFYMMTMTRLVIEKEEAYLGRKFGKTYVSYTSRARRWL